MVIPLRLWSTPDFRAYERQEYVIHAMYFGLAFGMVIFNVLLFLSLRDTTYLRYVAAVLCVMGAVAAKNGLLKEFVWQDAPRWSDLSTFTFYLLSYSATAHFMRHMLQSWKLAPRFDRLMQGLSIAYLFAPLGLLVSFATFANFIAKVNFVATVLMVSLMVYCAIKRQRSAYFLLAASMAMVLGSLLTVLKAPGLIPTGVLTLHGLQIGSALEMMLLALALADRFNLERLARVRAQEALVEGLQRSERELEGKVVQRTAELIAEQEKSHQLLSNILPEPIIAELTATGKVQPAEHRSATILFTDLAGFTQATATMPADRMVGELSDIFAAFDDITREEGVEKIKTIGDAYMAVAGISSAQPDHAERCVRAALRMQAFMAQRNEDATFKWNLRVGLHSGPVVSGVVGKHKYAFDIWGDAVNIASRMESSGEVGHVNVSAYTYDLVRRAFDCTYRGKIAAKGKGEIDMYFVNGLLPLTTKSA
jgi:class 3 adenylate cyclase